MTRTALPLLLLVALFGLPATAQESLEKAKSLLEGGKAGDALELLREDYENVKDSAEGMRLITQAAIETQEFEAALDYGLRAIELDKKSADAHLLTVKAFYFLGEQGRADQASSSKITGFYEEAVSLANAGLKLRAEDPELHSFKAHALYWLGEMAKSGEAFEEAQKYTPDDPSNLFYAARSYRLAQMNDKAIAACEKALKMKKDAGWLHLAHGESLAAAGKASEAAAAFGRALELDGGTDQGAMPIVQAVFSTIGENAAAGSEVTALWVKAHPKSALAHLYSGWFLTKQNQDLAAIEEFKKSFSVSGNSHAGAAVECSHAFFRQGKMQEAAEWLVTAQKTPWNWPEDKNAHPGRLILPIANGFASSGDFEKAVQYLEKYALDAMPNDWMILNNLGFFLRDWGERDRGNPARSKIFDRSREYYGKAVTAVLDDETATGTNRAQVLNDAGVMYSFERYLAYDLKKSLDLYRRAVAQDGTYVDALENLGLVLNALGKFEEAKGFFEKVLEQQPVRPVSRRGLAAAKKGLGG